VGEKHKKLKNQLFMQQSLYQLKQGLLDAYMRKQLKKPALVMAFS